MNQTFKRAMSLMLALAMVASMVPSFGTHVHAEELETEPVVVTEAPATEAPVVETPVEEVPETEAPTQAPETEAPATEAPTEEPEVVETEAPVVTEEATEAPEVETEPVEETEAVEETTPDATEETIPEEIFEEELIEEEAVMATLSGLSDTNIVLEGTTANRWTVGSNSLIGSVTGSKTGTFYFSASENLTITNNKSAAATISFDFKVTGNFAVGSTVSIDDTVYAEETTSSFSKELPAGGTMTIKLSAARCNASLGANTISINITNLQLLTAGNATITFKKVEHAAYSVNGEVVEADASKDGPSSNVYTLAVVVDDGYKFVGWYDATNQKYLSTDLEYRLQSDKDITVYPVVAAKDAAIFRVGDNYFADLNEAASFAITNSYDQITLVESGTISDGEYTIPAGVTLLVPMDTNNTPMAGAPEFDKAYDTPVAFLTLTLASGVKIKVEGNVEVEAKHTSLQGAQGARVNGGRVCGSYGAIYMNADSSIVLEDTAALYAWGYVYGKGSVTAKSGAEVYEYMQILDFPGGTLLSGFADTALDTDADGDGNPTNDYVKTFPMSQYYVQNIEVPLTLYHGADEYLYATCSVSTFNIGMPIPFIGTEGMFIPKNGYIVKDYIESADRMQVDIYGDSTVNGIVLDMSESQYAAAMIQFMGSDKFDSSQYILGLNSNITINVHSGTTTIAQDIALLPGVEITVDKGSFLNLALKSFAEDEINNLTVYGSGGHNVYVYDTDQWDNYVYLNQELVAASYSPTAGRYKRTAKDLKDAMIDINGTVIVDGYLYSTVEVDEETWMPISGGANVKSSGKTGKIVLQNGGGTEEFAYCLDGTSSVDNAVTVDSVWLKNGDGTFVLTDGAEPGATYNYCATHDCWYTGACEACESAPAAYDITWNFGGGKVDDKEYCTEEFEENVVPEYKGATPVKAETAQYTYTFAGWMDADGNKYATGTALPAATADVTYTAYYTETVREYKITWLDVNGDPIYSVDVAYGEMPAYDTAKGGELGDACHVLSWTPAVVAVTGEASYQAVLTESHSFTDKKGGLITAGTCMAEAVYELVCDNCDAVNGTVKGEKDPTNHTEQNTTVKDAVDATCGAEGYTGDTYCECGEKIKTGTSTPATGEHNYTIEVEGTRVDATCMAEGSVTKQCGCGAEKTETLPIDKTNHTKQNTTVKDAVDATCGEDGYTGDTYCECGEKIETGMSISATGDHKFTVEVEGSREAATCISEGSVTWKCENCKATETEVLEKDYENHASDEFSYYFVGWDENGNWMTTHEKSHVCCGNIADEAEPHDFDSGETEHTCICSAVEQFTLTVHAIQFANGDEKPYTEEATCEVPYGADLSEYLGVFPDLEFDIYQEGHTEFVDGKLYSGSFNITGWEYDDTSEAIVLGTMPAEDLEITQSWSFTGWYNEYYDENDEPTDTCFGTQRIEDSEIQQGWFGIDYGEGGDCDWYYLDPVTGYRAEGITRVPYPTEPLNGITYGPNAEDMANTEYGYTDATEAWFIFVGSNDPDGNSGKFLINYSGPANTQNDLISWAVKGMIPWHVGLIELEENVYAYFIGDEVNGGNVMATGDVYVTRIASDIERSFALGGVYTFGDNGLLIEYDGIVDMANGTKRYYDDAQLMLGAGLVEVPIDDEDNYRFIYVRSNGELVVNDTYWVAKTNEFDVVEGMYAFDENGYMIDPLDSTKNGVYEEDGGLFYYENGKRVYKGLIVYGDGYIYVRSNGQLAVGRYWVTVVNDTGFAAGFYVFDENGYMEEVKNGFVHENGSIYYYVTNQIQYNAGVIEVDGNYYYVRSNGEVVHDRTYWVTNVGDSGVLRQAYEFDIDGVMQNPQFEADQKGTGVYNVDGVLYYYVDGNIAYAAGLIKLDGGYIYVKSNGQLAIGDYWITNVGDTGVAQGMYTFGNDGYMITA